MPDPALTMSPAQRLAGYLNAIDTDADASELRVDEADLIARIYNALGAGPTVSHLTTHVATMLAGIRNNLSSDPDEAAATTEVDVLFGEVLDLLEAAYGGDGASDAEPWPIAGSLAAADFVNDRYIIGSTDLVLADVIADSDYQSNGQPHGGTDFRDGRGPFDAAQDIGPGGVMLLGHGTRIVGVQVPAGDFLDTLIADERTILLEFEDLTGSEGPLVDTSGLLLLSQDDSDSYTIEVDLSGSGLAFYDYGDFDVSIPAGFPWTPKGINRLGVTFGSGQASISINGCDVATGALDRTAVGQEITGLHIGPYLGADFALRKIVAYPAMSDADLKTLTTVSAPTGLLNPGDADRYGFAYYEVFDGTVPMNFAHIDSFGGSGLKDWFYGGFDPYLWDVTDPTNVNLHPLPGGACVVGQGLYVPVDLSVLPAWDATTYETIPDNERVAFVVEWLEDQNDVARKAGLLTQPFVRAGDGYVVGHLQAYFEGGHVKLRVLLIDPDDGINTDVTLVGPAVSAATVTRAAFLWDPATGDLAVSVNGSAAVTGAAQSAGGELVGQLAGKPVGFISEPTSATYAAFNGAQTASAGLGGHLREVTTLRPSWGVSDLPTLSAL